MSQPQRDSTPNDTQIRPPPSIALVGKDHRFTVVTVAFAAAVGYLPEELIGLKFEHITHPADVDIDSDLSHRLFRGELEHYEIAKRYVHKAGHLVRILLAVSAGRGMNGKIHSAIAKMYPLGTLLPGTTLPSFQHADEPNEQIERIKNAMFL